MENDGWEYYLGRVGLRRLVERAGAEAWIRYYRELAPTRIGPAGRWESIPPWRDVFASTFDVDLDEFYAAFDEWQADLAERNGRRPSGESNGESARIEGRAVRANGSPVAGRFVSANEIVVSSSGDRRTIGWQQRAETDAEGNFSVIAPNDGQYMLRIDLGVDRRCSIYYSREGGAHARDDADLLTVSDRTLRNVRFTVAADACRHKLRGTVRGLDGEPLAGIRLNGISRDGSLWLDEALTDRSGAFSITVPQDGDYRIDITLADSCLIYFTRSGATIDREAASLVQVAGADIRVDIRVPEDVCGNAISGRLLDALGGAMGDVWMTMERTVGGGGSRARGQTDSAGAFSITVPQDGDYRIRIQLAEGCAVYFANGGVTADRDMAATMRVAGRDVRGNITVPDGWCEHAINGQLLDASGGPMGDVQLAVVAEDPWSWQWARTDSTGTFSVTVPQDGNYRVRITLAEGCEVYFTSGGVTADRDMAATMRVAGRDVRGNITVPDGWCEHAISGRLLDASGGPMADVRLGANAEDSSSRSWARTDNTGAFSVTVPQDGDYRIVITLADSCLIYFTRSGATIDREAASLVQVAGADIRVDIRVPEGVCGNAISGRLLDTAGEPMTDVQLAVFAEDPRSWHWGRTDSTGAFNVTVPQDGSYRIHITLAEGCLIYFTRSGATIDREAASLVQVAGADIRVDIRVPEDVCGNAISGWLLDASGEPMTDVQLAVFAEDSSSRSWARTDNTGAFSVTVPQDGDYRIVITLAEGCAVYFASDGVTTDRDMAATVRVAGRNVRGDITVPDGWCEHAISGRLLDASGEPTADAEMGAILSDGTGGAWTGTGADGAFTLTIPQDGGYHISIALADGCTVYFASGGVTADRDMAATVRVAGRDVRGNITVPDGWCEHTIRGRLLSASGEPMADAEFAVISEDPPSWIWTRADSTGRFRFTVPQDGSYQIYFTLAGSCGVFVARNGVTRQQHAAAAIQVAGKDVGVGDIRVPAGTCDE